MMEGEVVQLGPFYMLEQNQRSSAEAWSVAHSKSNHIIESYCPQRSTMHAEVARGFSDRKEDDIGRLPWSTEQNMSNNRRGGTC